MPRILGAKGQFGARRAPTGTICPPIPHGHGVPVGLECGGGKDWVLGAVPPFNEGELAGEGPVGNPRPPQPAPGCRDFPRAPNPASKPMLIPD
jgi:hypothetical protein